MESIKQKYCYAIVNSNNEITEPIFGVNYALPIYWRIDIAIAVNTKRKSSDGWAEEVREQKMLHHRNDIVKGIKIKDLTALIEEDFKKEEDGYCYIIFSTAKNEILLHFANLPIYNTYIKASSFYSELIQFYGNTAHSEHKVGRISKAKLRKLLKQSITVEFEKRIKDYEIVKIIFNNTISYAYQRNGVMSELDFPTLEDAIKHTENISRFRDAIQKKIDKNKASDTMVNPETYDFTEAVVKAIQITKENDGNNINQDNVKFNLDKFAEIISLYRINHAKQSLREASLSIGISATTLNRIESRKAIPDLMTYYKLCKWCRYGMQQFFIEKN